MVFAWLYFDGINHIVKVTSKRTWRLRLAFDFILSCKTISGSSLEAIVGHFTWSCLVRREALSILDATYKFISQHRSAPAPIWSSVRTELRWARSVLPLLFSDIGQPWSPLVTATDASDLGFGVCEKVEDPAEVGSVGRLAEKWRYIQEDTVKARQSAFSSDMHILNKDFHDSVSGCVLSEDDNQHVFDEVPADFIKEGKWSVVQGRRWLFSENILRTEGRALVWAFRRLARSKLYHNVRLLFLADIMPL
eukprot:12428786-Karenia_brevis.AAC.1